MHAVYVEVESQAQPSPAELEQARQFLETTAVPAAREAGATAAYWFAGTGTTGRGVLLFEDEAAADTMIEQMPKVGEPASPVSVFRVIEVAEVLVTL